MPIWTVISLVILAVVVVMAIRERRRGLRGSADPQRTADRVAFETRAHLRGSQGPHGG